MSRCAWSTAAWAAVTCPACAEMLDGRSEAAESSAFCALTTACWALATASRPLSSVTSCCCFAASRLFCAVTTPLLAEVTADWALVQAADDAPEVDIVGTLGVLLVVVDDEPLDANIATAGLLAHAAFLASSALSSCFLAWLSARRALSTAVSAASFCASAWALVLSRIFWAWSRVSCEPATSGELFSLVEVACWVRSCPRAWSRACCAENGSMVASTWPAVTRSPTLTLTAVS